MILTEIFLTLTLTVIRDVGGYRRKNGLYNGLGVQKFRQFNPCDYIYIIQEAK